jgi:hypothetical protein
MSVKQEGICQDLQEGLRAGDREVKSRTFREKKRYGIVVGLAPSETNEYTAHRQSRSNKYMSIDHSSNIRPHQPEGNYGDKPGPTGTLLGSRLRQLALRRERLESKYRGKTEPREGGETEDRHHNEEMSVHL